MGQFETIVYGKKDHLAYVTLNRPHMLNVYNVKMRDELLELHAVKEDDEVRVLILKGAGAKGFCAGADLTEFLSAPSNIVARQICMRRDIWKLLCSLPQPVIVALHGYVFGSGVRMALFFRHQNMCRGYAFWDARGKPRDHFRRRRNPNSSKDNRGR